MTAAEERQLSLYADRFEASYRTLTDAALIRKRKRLFCQYHTAVVTRGTDVILRYGRLLGARRVCRERGLVVDETAI